MNWINRIPLDYYALSGLFNSTVGLAIMIFVLMKRPRTPLAHRFAEFTGLFTAWSFLYFIWLRETQDPIRATWLLRLCMLPVTLMPGAYIHFVAEWLGTKKDWKPWLIANYLISFLFASSIFTPTYANRPEHFLVFPFWLRVGPLFLFHVLHMLTVIIIGSWALYRRALLSQGDVRNQLTWVSVGFFTGFISGCTNYLVWFRVPVPPILNPLASLYAVCMAYAIVQHKLLDIRVVIRRGLVYSLLGMGITACYLVVVLITEKLFQGILGYQSVAITLVLAVVVAVSFNPLRNRLQNWADRAVFQGTMEELAIQRDRLLDEAQRSEQMRLVGTLAAGLAHEIKNPLAAIKTFTEHLSSKHTDPAFLDKFERIVGGELERINQIVQRLLDYAKPCPAQMEPASMAKLIRETLELVSAEAVKRQVDIVCGELIEITVAGDRRQLKQVLINLLLNAIEAMPQGGRILVSLRVEKGLCRIILKDSGRGITSDVLPHIFEPFYTSKPNGTGLGLPIVRNIVAEHGGSITLSSKLGQGTEALLTLPLLAKSS